MLNFIITGYPDRDRSQCSTIASSKNTRQQLSYGFPAMQSKTDDNTAIRFCHGTIVASKTERKNLSVKCEIKNHDSKLLKLDTSLESNSNISDIPIINKNK